MQKLSMLLGILVLSGCYPCLTSGDPVSSDKYKVYREAACAVVEGCDLAFMESIKVYEAPMEDLVDICNHPAPVYGCYCNEHGCLTIHLDPVAPEGGIKTALHEYIHAALDSAGIDSRDHSAEVFWKKYREAATLIEDNLRQQQENQ